MGSYIEIPPFPDDVPTAPLLKLSAAKLAARDAAEEARLFETAKDTGFFYLDLGDTEDGRSILSTSNEIFERTKSLFVMSEEEKSRLDRTTGTSYRNFSKNPAWDKRWETELLNITKDDLISRGSTVADASAALNNHRALLQSFAESSHAILLSLLESINDSLGLAPSTLHDMHRLQNPSQDQVRLTKCRELYETTPSRSGSSPSHSSQLPITITPHRDAGSITLLFNRLGGLQILPPGEAAEWCYVKPLPDHAIVNIGDAMVTFTNGLLRSNPHRVVMPPGQQAKETRHSLVYFMRPENDVIMRKLEGRDGVIPITMATGEEDLAAGGLTAEKWVEKRFLAVQEGKGLQVVSSKR